MFYELAEDSSSTLSLKVSEFLYKDKPTVQQVLF